MDLPDDPVELGAWVIEHGLPPLPAELDPDEIVAIARWAGEEYGAVLFVSWREDACEGEPRVDTDLHTYRRLDGAWLASEGSGGGGWFDEPLKRPDLPDEYAVVDHLHFTDDAAQVGPCCAAYGFAGRGAAFVEVVAADGSTVAPLDSPVGAVVVAANGSSDAYVRVLTEDRRVLTERQFAPPRTSHFPFDL